MPQATDQIQATTEQAEMFVIKGYEWIIEVGPRILLALVVLFIGLRVVKSVTKLLMKGLDKRDIDPTLKPFLSSLTGILLKAMLFISVASMLGIETTSFVAMLGAAGLAIGLALQGTLQNFASGVMLLVFKPFKKGDVIEAAGYLGTVDAIEIFVTKVLTLQNRLVIIPNGQIASSSLINYSAMETSRVDFSIGISYSSNIKTAKDVITKIFTEDERVLKDPAPMVVVGSLGDSSVNLTVRVWAKASDHWPVYFDFNERFKIQLEEAGVSIPFPQMDVHLSKD
jgi:small conductance mechanosensitive channel